jgi:3-hydroxy-9,10-secoandrosta-1,3,5(10)-triene-9,17-dione monooxygenase reductase component
METVGAPVAFDSALYRKVLGQFATGVTLVTTLSGGQPWAMTANSFTSISLVPPIVMVSISHGLTTNESVRQSGAFAVNILAADQMWLAKRFGGRNRPPDQFADVPLEKAATGCPVLRGCLAWVDCALTDQTEQGDHTVFFGTVQEMRLERQADPLLYHNSGYARIEPGPQAPAARSGASDGKLIFFDWEVGDY